MAQEVFSSVGLQNAVTILQSIQQTLGTLTSTVGRVFPLATGTAGTASGGAATLPASPVGFIEVYVPSLGSTVKVPYYT